MSQSSAFDRSETPKPRLRNTTIRFAVNVPDSPRSTSTSSSSTSTTDSSFKSRSNGRNLRFNLGGLPYVVTEFEDNRLGWKPAHTDLTGMGVLPMLGLEDASNNDANSGGNQTPTLEEMIRRKLMDETSIEFAERTQLVVGSGLGGRGFTFGKPESVGTRIERGSDLIAEGFVKIVFGWPGLPIIRAYPVPQPIGNSSHLTRAQLASLISSLVTSYFTWVLTLDYTQGIIPYIPWEYDAAPHAFLERYIRCLRLVKLGDSDMWVPVLGGRGLRIKEARWDIPRCAECEKGECNKAYEHP